MLRKFIERYPAPAGWNDSLVVGKKFKILSEISRGAFGRLNHAMDLRGQLFAVKSSRSSSRDYSIIKEGEIYELLAGTPGIPKIHYFGTENGSTFLVMDLMGANLDDLMMIAGGPFSLKTVLLILDQCFDHLKNIHHRGIVHRDVKPANMVMGRGKNKHLLYLLDFGLSTKFRTFRTHMVDRFDGSVGTPIFVSTNVHLGHTPSRRDDLESLAYTAIYLMQGKLPWERGNSKGVAGSTSWQEIGLHKYGTSVAKLCHGLPSEFETFVTYCRQLEFSDKPDYAMLKKKFRDLGGKMGFAYDYVYDWVTPEAEFAEPVEPEPDSSATCPLLAD